MNKEESMLQKRLVELSGLAYNRGIVVFSYPSIRRMVDMTYQSVRWLYFYLMLFIMSMNIRFRQ